MGPSWHLAIVLIALLLHAVTSLPVFDSEVIEDDSAHTGISHTFNHSAAEIESRALSWAKRDCVWNVATAVLECDLHWPKLSELVAHMQDPLYGGKATDDRSAIFYTNLRERTPDEEKQWDTNYEMHLAWAFGWAETKGISVYSFPDALDPGWLSYADSHIENHNDMDMTDIDTELGKNTLRSNILIYCYMQALAAAAKNPIAYLFSRKDRQWDPDSKWIWVEYWRLTQNPNIQKIMEVDPTPGACNDEPTLLWERGVNEEWSQHWLCPVKEK